MNSTPSTPETRPQTSLRRSFTLPSRFAAPSPPSGYNPSDSENVETLYTHPSARIVSFSPMFSLSRPMSYPQTANKASTNEEMGTLPWASLTERTIAAGALKFYRVSGSATSKVSFLNSGKVLQPILAKSQCWCVDGETKFVLRIRENAFYRIELPNNGQEDKDKAEELKQVLPKMLLYELTPCPFKRGFTVDLPEPPKDIRKRPWRPPERTKIREELKIEEERTEDSADEYATAASETESDIDSDATNGPIETTRASVEVPAHASVASRAKIFSAARPVSLPLPPEMNYKLAAHPESAQPPHPFNLPDEPSSMASSVDSFRSFQSPQSSLPPSPPCSDTTSVANQVKISHQEQQQQQQQQQQYQQHQRKDVSELTITPHSIGTIDNEQEATPTMPHVIPLSPVPPSPIPPKTPTLVQDSDSHSEIELSEAITPSPPTQLRRRRRRAASSRRSLSPLPLPANIFSPNRGSGNHLTTAILQKTISLVLGPPVQLVALMIRIACKIAGGTMRGFVLGRNEHGEHVPCHWDYADEPDDLDEDDFGVSLRSSSEDRAAHEHERHDGVTGSWDLD
ncbi:MAG: hypothetical protein M1834_001475 [Cirrosporium novae-zelandiae]|nr:MAG: hypothetical protein M1834_008619 [Cirrosporium novae-zelandiae]KAI9736009.1 MAG: hypothetical protein M1834_001475 [Cirrosporium novae-zelandiae]